MISGSIAINRNARIGVLQSTLCTPVAGGFAMQSVIILTIKELLTMKSKIWRVLIPLLLLSPTACESESETSRSPYGNDSSRAINASNYTGKKIALVIGNWLYRFKPLNNPQNDAREMAGLLEKLGFEVIHKENLGFEEMEDVVIKFKIALMNKGQVGLFYFAGHGLEVTGKNYLIPTDMRMPETQLIKTKSIPAQWVVNVMEHAGSQVNIVILDACRTFPRPDKLRATNEDYGLAAMNAPRGTLIGFATGHGQSTPDGKKGTNGLYTGHLLKFMGQPGLTIEEVFKKTRQQIALETRNKQVPPVYDSLIGDFCLVSCPLKPGNLQAQLEQERREKEALQRQLEALKNQPGPEPVVPEPSNEFTPGKVFRDRLADGSFGPEMVWIAAGSFRMGDIQGGGYDDEKPVHRVSVGRFAMGKYEITFADYDKFAQKTGRDKPSDSGWGRGNRPVINVSWHDAVAYTEWLSTQTGQTYRLPTEAEWEYAARAGTSTKYWWGNTASHKYANYGKDECCGGLAKGKDRWEYTSPVGSFDPNSFGLHDTVGNVWEWTCSEYENKYKGKEKQCLSKKHANNAYLSFRGGSWFGGASWMRSAFRYFWSATDRDGDLGFRVARY